jgi:hypothetical protein
MTRKFPSEPERDIDNIELGLKYSIYGRAPVQADGHIGSFPIYFRARHEGWSFTISLNQEAHASFFYSPHPEHFENGAEGFFRIEKEDVNGYQLEGDYYEGEGASYMPYDDAQKIIEDCTRRFLSEIKPSLS